MQFKYDTNTVVAAMERYLEANKDVAAGYTQEWIEREEIYRVYESLVRLTEPPQAVILDDYELDILYQYL